MGGARNSLPKSLNGVWYTSEPAPFPVMPFDLAHSLVERFSRELDITNADHIALWLEENLPEIRGEDFSIPWLACRIVEAYERATKGTDNGG